VSRVRCRETGLTYALFGGYPGARVRRLPQIGGEEREQGKAAHEYERREAAFSFVEGLVGLWHKLFDYQRRRPSDGEMVRLQTKNG
jgi:hypothetical protein